MSPASVSPSVDLPAPFGPVTPSASPARTSRSTAPATARPARAIDEAACPSSAPLPSSAAQREGDAGCPGTHTPASASSAPRAPSTCVRCTVGEHDRPSGRAEHDDAGHESAARRRCGARRRSASRRWTSSAHARRHPAPRARPRGRGWRSARRAGAALGASRARRRAPAAASARRRAPWSTRSNGTSSPTASSASATRAEISAAGTPRFSHPKATSSPTFDSIDAGVRVLQDECPLARAATREPRRRRGAHPCVSPSSASPSTPREALRAASTCRHRRRRAAAPAPQARCERDVAHGPGRIRSRTATPSPRPARAAGVVAKVTLRPRAVTSRPTANRSRAPVTARPRTISQPTEHRRGSRPRWSSLTR